jgi:TonB family protein
MYFDFEDGHPDLDRLPSALSVREEMMLAVIAHLLLVIAILVVPEMEWVKALAITPEAARVDTLKPPVPQQRQRFVLVQPRVDVEALRPHMRAPLSDLNREAATPERVPNARNRQPRSRGNTSEYVERTPPPSEAPRGRPETESAPSSTNGEAQTDTARLALPESEAAAAYERRPSSTPPAPAGGLGSLREALRNIERYTDGAQFDNPEGGGGDYKGWIQFDSKGVEFGPWIRRFVAQVKRNWFVPMAAMSLKGHVVITFNVHRNGALTDLTVVGPSNVEAFNHAAFNALVLSNPTQPLPAEYPDDKAFFTVTFFYNESPPPGP